MVHNKMSKKFSFFPFSFPLFSFSFPFSFSFSFSSFLFSQLSQIVEVGGLSLLWECIDHRNKKVLSLSSSSFLTPFNLPPPPQKNTHKYFYSNFIKVCEGAVRGMRYALFSSCSTFEMNEAKLSSLLKVLLFPFLFLSFIYLLLFLFFP